MNQNQLMIYLLTKKRNDMKSRYYYIKSKLRPQELEVETAVYLANCDFIAKWLKYYRAKEFN